MFVRILAILIGFPLLSASTCISASETNLTIGVTAMFGGFESADDIKKTSSMDAIAVSGGQSIGFIQDNQDSTYWVLYKNSYIRNFDLAQLKMRESFSLDGYPEAVSMAGEQLAGAEAIANGYGEEFKVVDDPSAQQIEPPLKMNFDNDYKMKDGCLSWFPLRYGDLRGVGSSEFVIVANAHLLIFSPAQRKLVFATRWLSSDQLDMDAQESFLSEREEEDAGLAIPRYLAYSSIDTMVNQPLAAMRSFGKVFFGDFDGDGIQDLILWRKLFESTYQWESRIGFYKKGETFAHYKFIEGVYQLQRTPAAQAQAWLAAKNMTWQTGFPSKSLCPGQEGQLIPEMHDRLLNDPDVLH